MVRPGKPLIAGDKTLRVAPKKVGNDGCAKCAVAAQETGFSELALRSLIARIENPYSLPPPADNRKTDQTGSYDLVIKACLGLLILAFAVLLMLPRPNEPAVR